MGDYDILIPTGKKPKSLTDLRERFAKVYKDVARPATESKAKVPRKEIVADISYIRNKLGFNSPTEAQVLSSQKIILTCRFPLVDSGPAQQQFYSSTVTNGKRSLLPILALELETGRQRKLSMATLAKAQINAEVKRTTMIMDKIHEYRKNSLTKKEKRGRDARKHFKQDGDLLRSVKRELAQDKKKRIEAKRRRMTLYHKLYLGDKVQRGSSSSVSALTAFDGDD
ncbi:hypothetical protein BgiMline_020450 [Biomphalaria glabrata]|nr:hypothetical protein BgiMline_017656 [Biomphalaria glabrata]KAI8779136.1 hypothetical protein BgiBS90_020118 [Biomphalaria glabrata]